jgi:hypothetical protein
LDSSAPAGLCPSCLIQGAFDSSLGADEAQTIDTAPAAAGDDDFGRYHIVRALGEGGMVACGIRKHHPLAGSREEESGRSVAIQDIVARASSVYQADGNSLPGCFWYFRPRGQGPGSRTHVAHGNPLTLDIRSSDFVPLVMEAHHDLGTAIPLACCREIQVTIENNDNMPGGIALGMLLTDSTSLGKPTLYLGQQRAQMDHRESI